MLSCSLQGNISQVIMLIIIVKKFTDDHITATYLCPGLDFYFGVLRYIHADQTGEI